MNAAEHETGEAILAATAELLGERGYRATTTRAIAEKARRERGHHLPSLREQGRPSEGARRVLVQDDGGLCGHGDPGSLGHAGDARDPGAHGGPSGRGARPGGDAARLRRAVRPGGHGDPRRGPEHEPRGARRLHGRAPGRRRPARRPRPARDGRGLLRDDLVVRHVAAGARFAVRDVRAGARRGDAPALRDLLEWV